MASPTPAALLPSRRRRTAVRLGAAAIGLAIGFASLALLWPKSDRSLETRPLITPADLAKPPARPVTLLIIGIDANRISDPLNRAAPSGPANADALVLVRVNPEAPTQVLSLPPELAVALPGQRRPVALGRLYRLGGPALLGDAISELVGLGTGQPDRYLVLSRAAVRSLVNGLGGIEANAPRAMRYRDRAQDFSIDLQAGLQRLDGAQVEQLLRYRDPLRPQESRSDDQQEVGRALLRAMLLPTRLAGLPALVNGLRREVDTNLSQTESLSLLAGALGRSEGVEFSTVPLSPVRASHGALRQLSPAATPPLWPPAQPVAAP